MSTTTHSFRIDGEFTIYRAAELAAALKMALADVGAGDALEIELGEVAEMDCAGVQLLLAAHRSARESGRALRVAGRSPAVLEVFQSLQLAAHFDEAQ